MAGLLLGARCIRGPDWQWDDQDGGPGTEIILNN
jgi:Mib_herc2